MFREEREQSQFEWSMLGDLKEGHTNSSCGDLFSMSLGIQSPPEGRVFLSDSRSLPLWFLTLTRLASVTGCFCLVGHPERYLL